MLQPDSLLTRSSTVMSRWAMAALSALTLIIGLTILHASPPQSDHDYSHDNSIPKLSKVEKRREKAMRKDMQEINKQWAGEEVPYIITRDEDAAFKKLTTDQERDDFIENFWERRNPNPGSPENAYKEEYYRRVAFANERYGCAVPGWKSDRGRIYIMYGPPDEIDSNPLGGPSAHPIEQWKYRNLEGIGTNIVLQFSDSASSGEYPLIEDPGFRDILLQVHPDFMTSIESSWSQAEQIDKAGLTRLDIYTGAVQPPTIKFKDLNAIITSKLSAHLLPFEVRTDYVRLTDETVLTPVTIRLANYDLLFHKLMASCTELLTSTEGLRIWLATS